MLFIRPQYELKHMHTTNSAVQYLTHGYSPITPAVAVMDSFFVLVRTHQHGIASEVSLTITVCMRKVLAIPRGSRRVGSVCFSLYCGFVIYDFI